MVKSCPPHEMDKCKCKCKCKRYLSRHLSFPGFPLGAGALHDHTTHVKQAVTRYKVAMGDRCRRSDYNLHTEWQPI